LSLREARRNFADFGACDRKSVEHVLSPEKRGKFRYDPRSIM
jgi:hypothetical protein